jgi:LL-diaminopimelate aminotransferase
MFSINYSERLSKLPPYLFLEIDKKKKALLEKGVDVIDLGVGDPDQPTPKHIIAAGKKALGKPENHKYPFGAGLKSFRQTVAVWYKQRFNVELNPDNEIISLIGSKEGIGHIHLAFANPGDVVLVPEPGYPVYNGGTILSGGVSYFMPLLEKNNFLPDLEAIPEDILQKAKLLFINYPNNPTAGVADRDFFTKVVKLARQYNIIVCHDASYTEMYYDDYRPMSFLEIEGAKEVGIEFHSLSKTYNMTGWRIGWACGNKDILKGLADVKANIDSGAFQAVQEAAITALSGPQDCVLKMRRTYRQRRNTLVRGLKKLGFSVKKTQATFYVWAKVPKGYSSIDASARILEQAAVITTPGIGFGPSGEGYIRMALTVDKKRLVEAVERLKKIEW